MTQPLRCVLVGAGAWGTNILRALVAHPLAELSAVVDPSESARESARARAPGAFVLRSLHEAILLGVPLDAALIASPAGTHAPLAAEALSAGLALLCEKPLTTDAGAADALVALAQCERRPALVGHLMRYHPAVVRLLELARSGAIGTPRHVVARRRSPPPPRRGDGSALWALGPHDLSVALALDRSALAEIRADESAFDAQGVSHAALLRARFASGLALRLELSRVHPQKERVFAVLGDEGALVFDDMRPAAQKLVLVEGRGVDTPAERLDHDELARRGRPLPLAPLEPLAEEIDHFVRAVLEGGTPRTPLSDGATIVRWLARAERRTASLQEAPRQSSLAR
ncbi:MAG: Gfo/Idh/MocA family oxidoreductase [Polyangiaceae bacterium]|nr:Gfo/Idh/MocA family oxidoreductase [Polyangiaceae bacterium]